MLFQKIDRGKPKFLSHLSIKTEKMLLKYKIKAYLNIIQKSPRPLFTNWFTNKRGTVSQCELYGRYNVFNVLDILYKQMMEEVNSEFSHKDREARIASLSDFNWVEIKY